ncbi:acyl carrier protein [Vallitalea guaymasensis]|uniref:acyl carrier protein n=1 Tax=Vallitalea guaymasensis TaxID=1185412 RepID=UPI000DE34160|nr:acyl carrier protein [Vallitalea guaymasensis]
MDYKKTVIEFFEERYFVSFGEDFEEDTDLFKAGIIESKGYISIINFLRNDLDIEMTDEDIFLNVFATVADIVKFIEEKKS